MISVYKGPIISLHANNLMTVHSMVLIMITSKPHLLQLVPYRLQYSQYQTWEVPSYTSYYLL